MSIQWLGVGGSHDTPWLYGPQVSATTICCTAMWGSTPGRRAATGLPSPLLAAVGTAETSGTCPLAPLPLPERPSPRQKPGVNFPSSAPVCLFRSKGTIQ